MKKVIVLAAALLSVSVIGYSQTSAAEASRREKIAVGALTLMLQDANYKEELKIVGVKLRKITAEQSKALAQANVAVEYIRLWLEPKISSDKELFEVSLALRNIKSANDFLLQYGGEKSDKKLRMRALATMSHFHQSLQTLKKLNGAIYKEVEYLLTDPRLPEIERELFECVDQGYKECYK